MEAVIASISPPSLRTDIFTSAGLLPRRLAWTGLPSSASFAPRPGVSVCSNTCMFRILPSGPKPTIIRIGPPKPEAKLSTA